MAGDQYRRWLSRLVPPWLQGQWGGAFIEELAGQGDDVADRLAQARRAMMPGVASVSASADALEDLGAERGLEQGATETPAQFGERLRVAWEDLPRAGSHRFLLEQLKLAGFTPEIVQRSGRRTTLDGSGNLDILADSPIWTLSGKPPEAYAEFILLFRTDQPTVTWSEAAGYSTDAARITRLAQRWRPAKAEYVGAIIQVSGAIWGAVTWGAFNWGGVTRFIPPA